MKRRPLCPGLPGKLLSQAAAIVVPSIALTGCLDRPIGLVEPRTSTTITERLTGSPIDKIDILLAIDNSASMADKQAILAATVPDLVESLVNPPCVDGGGTPIDKALQPKGPKEDCPQGTQRDFEPVLDIHIGIISSSLGGHGGSQCKDEMLCDNNSITTSNNDHGRLLSRADACDEADLVPTYAGKGFLAWDPDKRLDPPGESDLGSLIPTLTDMVKGVGQIGCGYESQLESIYRFLVDPEPYATIAAVNGKVQTSGKDDVLLAQRSAFLRPDSLVTVLMLSDENDCSIKEYSYFYAAADAAPLPRPRAVCKDNPSDPCCTSCGLPVPAGCPADPTCFDPSGKVLTLPAADDPVNLRCFDQKRRFGIDFLYPTDRYVTAFSSTQIANRSGEIVDNPLFLGPNAAAGDASSRPIDHVFLAGIVGVPWQDLARDPSDLTKGLKSAEEMNTEGDPTWAMILGDPAKGVLPSDPLMRESIGPRSGVQPVTKEPLDETPATPNENSINGHEWSTLGKDLQYACIFDLPDATDCSQDSSCSECQDPNNDNPLCDENARTMRVRAKAYPGSRQLEVLRGLDKQGIVGSVCPKQVENTSLADYGYRPAIGAIVDQLKTKLRGPCLPRTPNALDEGHVKCVVVEAKVTGGACGCDSSQARLPLSADHLSLASHLREQSSVDWDCFCEIPQLEGDGLVACQNDVSGAPLTPSGEPVDGFCYIDATTDPQIGNPAIVSRCPANEKRLVRLVGAGAPSPGGTVYVICSADSE